MNWVREKPPSDLGAREAPDTIFLFLFDSNEKNVDLGAREYAEGAAPAQTPGGQINITHIAQSPNTILFFLF